MPFNIVAHNAALASGDCQAESAADTSRYTCRYSVATSVAKTDPGNYKVSVSAAIDTASGTALEAYDTDTGVTIAVRPEVRSVKFYPDSAAAIAATNDIPQATIGSVFYAVIRFSENMENRNLLPEAAINAAGLPNISIRYNRVRASNVFSDAIILAHDAEFDPLTDVIFTCRAKSADDTSEYLCQINSRDYYK